MSFLLCSVERLGVSVNFVPQTAHAGDFGRDCASGKEKVESDDVTLFLCFVRCLIDWPRCQHGEEPGQSHTISSYARMHTFFFSNCSLETFIRGVRLWLLTSFKAAYPVHRFLKTEFSSWMLLIIISYLFIKPTQRTSTVLPFIRCYRSIMTQNAAVIYCLMFQTTCLLRKYERHQRMNSLQLSGKYVHHLL